MQLFRFSRNWWRRASAASKTDAVLAVLTFTAKVYTVGFAIWMAGAKFSVWHGPDARAFWVFVAALGYVTAQPYFPKRVSTKWVTEDLRRTKALAVAITEIESAVWNRKLRPEERHGLFMRLLSAIKSEVESITGDHEGIYLNVSLLLDDNQDRLKVVCRANQDRPLTVYRKVDLLISKTLVTGESFYEPDCKFDDKPYRAVFAMPLISAPANCKASAIGVLSIDSSQSHCFDGLTEEIESKTLPYISLLKLVIIAEEALNQRRGNQNGQKR